VGIGEDSTGPPRSRIDGNPTQTDSGNREPRGREEDRPSLARSALGGVAWNWGGSVVLVLAQIASTAITARLVAPHEFGLYATALAAAGFASYLTMAAVGPGLQRRSRLGERTVGTAQALSLASSLLVAGALWLGASWWADLWGIPAADWVVRAMAITLCLTSMATVPLALLRRDLKFRKAVVVETSSAVTGLASGVVLAVWLHSALALALGQAVGALMLVAVTSLTVRRQLQVSFDIEDARELFTFATQVGGLGFFQFLTITAPSLFVARTFGSVALGFYSRAYLIAGLPAEYVVRSVYRVIYPMYGRVRDDLARTKVLLDEALTLVTGFVWPLFALIAGASPVIVHVLLGSRWADASSLLLFFAVAAGASVPTGFLTNAAEAMGWMRIIATRQLVFLAGVVGVVVGVSIADLGLSYLVAGIAGAHWVAYGLTLEIFIRRRLLAFRSVMRGQLVHIAMAMGAFGAAFTCAHLLAGMDLLVQIAAQIAVGAGVIGALISVGPRIPAIRVLGRRIGTEEDESIVRGLATLR
jgi:PST family polysaccharide transporter